MDNAVLQQILTELQAALDEAAAQRRQTAQASPAHYHYFNGFMKGIAQAIHVIRSHADTEDQQREGVAANA